MSSCVLRLQGVLWCGVFWLSSSAWAQKNSLDEFLSPLQLKVEDERLPYRELPREGRAPMSHYFREFRRTPAWQADLEPSKQIAAIKLVCTTTGLSVQIVASVLRGVVASDRFPSPNLIAEPFGTYVLHLDQPLSLHELLKFGIEPLRVSVVMAKPSVETQPRVVNQVPSLAVTRIEERHNAFDLFLKNSSTKPILGLEIKIQRKVGSSVLLLTGWRGLLIDAGKEYQVLAHKGLADLENSKGLAHGEPSVGEIAIVAALFADGSHEGDEAAGVRVIGLWQGIQIQNARLLEVVKRTLGRNVQLTPQAIDDFRQEVMSVSETFDLSVLEDLAERYPSLDEPSRYTLKLQLESGLRGAKQSLLLESEHLKGENDQPGRIASSFQSWLAGKKEEYEQLQAWSVTP